MALRRQPRDEGGSIRFPGDGVWEYIAAPHNAGHVATTGITLQGVFRFNAALFGNTFIHAKMYTGIYGSPYYSYAMMLHSGATGDGNPRQARVRAWLTIDGAGHSTTQNPAFPDLTQNTWYDYVITWDAASGKVGHYIDGVLVHEETWAGATLSDDGGEVVIGNRSYGASDGLDGDVSVARMWKRALTADEVRELHRTGVAPYRSDLGYEFLMTDGTGTTVTDSSPTGVDGTRTGTKWNRRHSTSMGQRRLVDPDWKHAVEFDNGYSLDFPDGAYWDGFTQQSQALWFKPAPQDKYTTQGRLMSNIAGGVGSFELLFGSSQILQCLCRDSDSVLSQENLSVEDFDGRSNEWIHLAHTVDLATGLHRGYVDGKQVAENTAAFTGNLNPGSPMSIGGTATGNYCRGQIARARWWGTELTPDEILNEYLTGKAPHRDLLMLEAMMSEGVGGILNDTSPNGLVTPNDTNTVWRHLKGSRGRR